MADGSREDRTDPKQINEITFSVKDTGLDQLKQCSGDTSDTDNVQKSLCTERETCITGEKCVSGSVAVDAVAGSSTNNAPNKKSLSSADADDRKKRCFDRYDSSESSDSGVAVLSPTESGGCSSSDITEPGSPRSPESSCGVSEDSAGTRMPPWACESAGPRRLPPPAPAPPKRPQPPLHRRITEFFSHKMKSHNSYKRDNSNSVNNDDAKKKCLPNKNGVTDDLEKYISYLSQTLNPRVLLDVGKEAEAKPLNCGMNSSSKSFDNKTTTNTSVGGFIENNKVKDNKDRTCTNINGFIDGKNKNQDFYVKNKSPKQMLNRFVDNKKRNLEVNYKNNDPSANGVVHNKIPAIDELSRKYPVGSSNDLIGKKVLHVPMPDSSKAQDAVSSTTRLDSKMNGVTYGSNNVSLSPIVPRLAPAKKDVANKKVNVTSKRASKKSSTCVANKNLTWARAKNLKQIQFHKKACMNNAQSSTLSSTPNDSNPMPKMSVPNGVRQVPINVNGLNNLNVPLQNCHQISIQQPVNGTVPSTNLTSFVTVPQNVMLAALRIPQNGLQNQTVNQQNGMTFTRQNVNVSSPTKINSQFVFPLVQNINGAVVQIPNLMAKVPNFVLPQTPQRQDHLQNQQAAQILINGTLLKLANTMTSAYSSVNKTVNPTNPQVVNKNVPGMPAVGMTVQSKPNYAVSFSHPVLVPQPGFIVTSVPNITVKETWCNTSTNSASTSQTTLCSNPIVQHPPPVVTNYTNQLHTSSIPMAPVKPPDNPIQGTDPPSSTVKEPESLNDKSRKKSNIPWLAKNVNNNIVPFDTSNKITRPFAQVSNLSEKLTAFSLVEKTKVLDERTSLDGPTNETAMVEAITSDEKRRVEEVARREDTIFTQITVLKDVSSNVQNTVIETNYSSVITESSESGIGTDKSIDSPSDSQTSKECDEDSSLSLSVSVCSVELPSSQKSPILKQPKTLRFPPKNLTKGSGDKRNSSTDTASTVTVCLWENCKREFDSDSDLLEHLQVVHVESQVGQDNYKCQWERCKVKGKPSCSRLWLERHTMSHGGNKPFKCIVDECGRRFSTQILLERHVNNHFSEQSPNTSNGKKTDSAPKLIKRNGKKLRYRRQPWSARMFDFFDAGTMEGLAWRLMRCTRWRLSGSCPLREPTGRHTLTLHAALTATRYNTVTSCREALITYYPPNVLEDEWVPEKEVKHIKRVEISKLPTHAKVVMYEQFCASYRKAASPPPRPVVKPTPPPQPARVLPTRQCTSSRLLNNLIAKQKRSLEPKDCPSTNLPIEYQNDEKTKVEVSGAKKRKLGRRHGGNAFWPCGR